MSITVGDKVPSTTLYKMGADGPEEVSTTDYCAGRKVVIFGVPGAFTPTCSAKHVPGFIQNAEALKAKGIEAIACVSVNDAFVMGAWAKDQGTGDTIDMLGDGSGELAKAMDIELDLCARGLGIRGKRFSLVAEDGVIKHLALQNAGELTTSSAEEVLKVL
ncbi:MAG: putative peroxiredoxin [Alphaproteobacteria bacterium MarineAlpha4_Bin2]|nr:MAG: putative peroxiredoxin [Alphaproteobacteria bacterium MarineAlpha4_Bin2]|tara:strand:+ start:1151 stop:1633 length:483 start_codon:yes stop_codon:yes gene_type:complete